MNKNRTKTKTSDFDCHQCGLNLYVRKTVPMLSRWQKSDPISYIEWRTDCPRCGAKLVVWQVSCENSAPYISATVKGQTKAPKMERA